MLTGRNQKGIFPIVTGTESVKATLTKKEDNIRATPPKGIESI